jgi:copper transport protein
MQVGIKRRFSSIHIRILFIGLFLLFSLGLPLFSGKAWAHASLVSAVPEQDSVLTTSPEKIAITFNERLEDGVYYIKLYDQRGSLATLGKAHMNNDHTGLELEVPKLPDGLYLVSYHVISSDGHPVSGSYPITVGAVKIDMSNPEGNAAAGTGQTGQGHQHGVSSTMSLSELGRFLSRGLWYFTYLALLGWVLWMHGHGVREAGEGGVPLRKLVSSWTLNLQRAHVLALLLMMLTHMEDLLGDSGIGQLGALLTGTGVGLSWIALMALSICGFFLLMRSVWIDAVWFIAMILSKSLTGHAMGTSLRSVTVPLNAVHLSAAALWVGGLFLFIAIRKLPKEAAAVYLRRFSRMALVSIVLLTITGTMSILIFLPKLSYLLYTQWGIFLLVKIGLVALVVLIGAILRGILRKREGSGAAVWIKTDFGLMLAIVIIVGFLTYLAPVPPNEPLHWHVMGDKVHMTTAITPNSPGVNSFETKIWLPAEAGAPKYVQLWMKNQDDAGIAPIAVPMELVKNQSTDEVFGAFLQYSYKAQGAYIPFAGNWQVEVRVMTQADEEIPYHKTYRIY